MTDNSGTFGRALAKKGFERLNCVCRKDDYTTDFEMTITSPATGATERFGHMLFCPHCGRQLPTPLQMLKMYGYKEED